MNICSWGLLALCDHYGVIHIVIQYAVAKYDIIIATHYYRALNVSIQDATLTYCTLHEGAGIYIRLIPSGHGISNIYYFSILTKK